MPTRAKMTIISLYNYDDTLFADLNVPSGDSDQGIPDMDKTTAINKILIDCAEFELMYPDLDFMKMAIKNWSDINQRKWQKLYNTETVVYNPIYNVDATETETHNLTYDRDDKGNYKGFNSSTLQNVNQALDKDTDTGTIKTERAGNIGVTSTQQLLTAEREISDFSTYQVIADDFKNAFCCLIY